MALFTMEETASVEKETKELIAKNPSFDSITPMEDIVKQISGFKWEVDYYNLVSEIENFQSSVDFGIDEAITEYNLIKNMVLIVDSAITNEEPSQITGSGTIDGDFIPKNGDFFLAKLVDGGVGIFTLTSVKKETYNLNHIFKIEYKLFYVLRDKEDKYYEKIKSKTINTFFYNREYLSTSDKKMFTSEEKSEREQMLKMEINLINIFNKKVLNTATKYTLTTLENKKMVYDPYIEDFILSVIGENTLTSKITVFGIDVDNVFTILNVLKGEADYNLVNRIRKQITTKEFIFNPFLRSLNWSGVEKTIKVTTGEEVINYIQNDKSDTAFSSVDESYYIFSKNFYDCLLGNVSGDFKILSTLEKIVLDVINGSTIDFLDIKKVYESLVKENSNTELLYYIPILIYILRYRKNVTNVEHF